MQKVLNVSTVRNCLRSEVTGWTFEDGSYVSEALHEFPSYGEKNNVPVGLIRSPYYTTHYCTVLHALGDGWKLLAPPTEVSFVSDDGDKVVFYDWWLVKD